MWKLNGLTVLYVNGFVLKEVAMHYEAYYHAAQSADGHIEAWRVHRHWSQSFLVPARVFEKEHLCQFTLVRQVVENADLTIFLWAT